VIDGATAIEDRVQLLKGDEYVAIPHNVDALASPILEPASNQTLVPGELGEREGRPGTQGCGKR
jgi:hypothetical protein